MGGAAVSAAKGKAAAEPVETSIGAVFRDEGIFGIADMIMLGYEQRKIEINWTILLLVVLGLTYSAAVGVYLEAAQ